MKKAIKRLIDTILVLFGIASAVGLTFTLFPEYFNAAFELLGLSESQIGMATVVLSGITIFGSMSKYLGGVINTSQILHQEENARVIRMNDEKHRAEIEQIKNEKNEETKIYTTVINELIDNQNTTQERLDQILTVLAITARRNANTENKLISEEDKQLYRDFLRGLNQGEETIAIENLYTTLTITEEIKPEEVEEDSEENEPDTLAQRL